MAALISSGVSGLIFGLGLCLSHMTDPAKVVGFLDFFGDWDPGLAWVMVGAIGVHLPARRWLARRKQPWFARSFKLPSTERIDAKLVIGAAIFGIGWGTVGYCPAPAVTSAAAVSAAPVVLGSMLFGIAIYEWYSSHLPVIMRIGAALRRSAALRRTAPSS